MNSLLKKAVFISVFLLGLHAWARTYIVSTGDTLSQISRKSFSGPVYGANGSLERVLRLNPAIKNPHFLKPGQEIVLEEALRVNASDDTATSVDKTVEDPALPAKDLAIQADTSAKKWIRPVAGYAFTSFSSKDTSTGSTATLVSAYHFSVGAELLYEMQEQHSLFVGLIADIISIQPSNNATKTLSNTNQFLAEFDFGAIKKWSEETQLKYYFSYQNELFLHGTSTTNVSIDGIPIPGINALLQKKFYERGNDRFNFLLGLSYYFSASADGYNQNAGYGWLIGAEMLTSIKTLENFSLSLGVKERRQDSTLTSNTQDDFWIKAQLTTDFLSGTKKP